MEIFEYEFLVNASLEKVRIFHYDSSVLKKLNPPPFFVQVHHFDPMGEGSISDFTLWMGPLPVHWRAVHSQVSDQGFTDNQESGPMALWRHTHRFEAINNHTTLIREHIEYNHFPGWRGLLTRLLFSPLPLRVLFTYRKWATRRELRTG